VKHVGRLHALQGPERLLGRRGELEVGVVKLVVLLGEESIELVQVRIVVDLGVVVNDVWIPAISV
jgi:hypothetical protein